MKRVRKTLIALAAAVLVGALLRTCVVTSYLIPSTGMENSLYQGERIVVNKWSYGLRLPFMQWWGYHRWVSRPVEREDIIVFNNPGNLRQPLISRREAFIGRCIGTPGDTLLVDSLFNAVSSERLAPDQKFLFAYPLELEGQIDSLLAVLDIRSPLLGSDSARHIRGFSRYERYLLEQATDTDLQLTPQTGTDTKLYPLVIPGRGHGVRVRPWNRTLLCNTLADSCSFSQDYYWVAANNDANLSDSRLFGFVPQDHVIGRAARIWLSKEQGTPLFSGYRWQRIGMRVQ